MGKTWFAEDQQLIPVLKINNPELYFFIKTTNTVSLHKTIQSIIPFSAAANSW